MPVWSNWEIYFLKYFMFTLFECNSIGTRRHQSCFMESSNIVCVVDMITAAVDKFGFASKIEIYFFHTFPYSFSESLRREFLLRLRTYADFAFSIIRFVPINITWLLRNLLLKNHDPSASCRPIVFVKNLAAAYRQPVRAMYAVRDFRRCSALRKMGTVVHKKINQPFGQKPW